MRNAYTISGLGVGVSIILKMDLTGKVHKVVKRIPML